MWWVELHHNHSEKEGEFVLSMHHPDGTKQMDGPQWWGRRETLTFVWVESGFPGEVVVHEDILRETLSRHVEVENA